MKPRVVVSLLNSGQEFQRMQASDAALAGRRLGIEVEVVFAENNALEQIHQLYKYVHAPEGQRPLAIIVEAVSRDGMERLARNALKAGIGWVAEQWKAQYIETLRREKPAALLTSVSVDEEEIGRIQGRQLKAILGPNGRVLLCQGPPESAPAVGRLQGLQRELEGSGITVKGLVTADWTTRTAEAAVLAWLRLKTSESGIDGVASQNDSMALGARNAILAQRKDWSKIPFTGCDGLPDEGQRLVMAGQLAATIVKPTTAGPAVELVARSLQGHPAPPELVLHPRSYPPLEELSRVALRTNGGRPGTA
jgi:ABC-type sugar transport system substrate-binding protein